MRIVLTSDLHLEITGREPIRRMVAGISHSAPDLVIVAGDIGNPTHVFEQCLAEFIKLSRPIAVVAGNHDLWFHADESSHDLYTNILPSLVREMGFYWLDGEEPMVVGNLGIAGSIGWYDYSARDPLRGNTDEEIAAMKPRFALDAMRCNWQYSDQEFAAQCRARVERQLEALEANPAVEKVLVATHVPAFENQIDRRPQDELWTLGNPFFGHYTLGNVIARFPKVRWTVSGHTHIEMHGLLDRDGMPPIATGVIGSDYYKPRYLIVDTEEVP